MNVREMMDGLTVIADELAESGSPLADDMKQLIDGITKALNIYAASSENNGRYSILYTMLQAQRENTLLRGMEVTFGPVNGSFGMAGRIAVELPSYGRRRAVDYQVPLREIEHMQQDFGAIENHVVLDLIRRLVRYEGLGENPYFDLSRPPIPLNLPDMPLQFNPPPSERYRPERNPFDDPPTP
jgi:hypothetical protein